MVLFLVDGDPDPILNMFGAVPVLAPNWVAPALGAPKEGPTELLNEELAPKAGAPVPPVKLKFGLGASDEEGAFPNENTLGLLAVFDPPKLKTGAEVLELPKGGFA